MKLTQRLTKSFIVIFLILFLLPVATVLAQTPPQIDDLNVALWPEYDRADVLVVYHVKLNPSTPLPAQLTFQLPGYIQEMFAVAVERDGQLMNVPAEEMNLRHDGDYLFLTFSATETNIQFEYYDPVILTKDGAARQLAYKFYAPYNLENVKFDLQQPVEAQDFVVTPTSSNTFTGANGLTYSAVQVGKLTAGDPFEITATYQRPTDALSVDSLPASAPLSAPAPAQQPQLAEAASTPPYLGYGLIGAGVVLLLATGGYWWMQNKKSKLAYAPAPRRQSRRKKFKKSRNDGSGSLAASGGGYCYNCGAAMRRDANFCHACGAQRRQN